MKFIERYMNHNRREGQKMNKEKSSKKIKKGTIKRLLQYVFDGYGFQFGIVLVFILVSALSSVAGSLFIKSLIDDYISPLLLQENPVFTGLARAIFVMAAIYIIGILSNLFYNRIMVSVSQGVLKKIRDEMFIGMQKLPIQYFDTHSHGDIMSYYTNDADTLRQMISQSIPQLFNGAITVFAVFIAMLSTSLSLTAVVVLFTAIMLLVAKKVAGKSTAYFVKQQSSLGELNGYIEEMIGGQKVVKVFCHEEKAKQGFDSLNEKLFENADAANKFANILMPIMQNIGNLQYVLIAIVGGILALDGRGGITIGAIAAFLQLSKSFSQPISQISQQLSSVAMALAGAARIFELMDEEPETDEGYVTLVNAEMRQGVLTEVDKHTGIWAWKHPHGDGTITYTRLMGEVQFFGVDFEYEEGKRVLHDITIQAEPGKKIAFVGATGAGKTTITNLINRFYDIADGKIRYDNININKIKKSDLRRSLGIVLQDTNLFSGTVKENIRYGNPNATDEEVIKAAEIANADSFIKRLPNGYDTMLEFGGDGLSQGQRQLISIARVAAADPPVMILDEATSSIDTRTEAIVQRGMDRLMNGRTVFVIAHRLSTVKNSHEIVVLDHGKIKEKGNHENLIKKKGMYYQLYTGAFEME